MATAMHQSKNTFEKKFVGIVLATVGEKMVKFETVDESRKFPNGSTILKVALEDLPAVPKFTPKNDDIPSPQTGKQFRIRLNQDGDEVEDVAPVTGHFVADLVNLGPSKKDEEPTPYEKPNFNDPDKTHLEFFALYKIVKGSFKGVESAFYLHYKFEESPEAPGWTGFKGNFEFKNATRLFQLRDWGVTHGLWEWKSGQVFCDPIPWNDVTILPELRDRILEGGKTRVDITFKNGYIVDVQPLQDDEEEDAPKAKSHVVDVDKVIEELGYEKPTKKTAQVTDELDVDKDFQKDEPKRAKKAAKKVQVDEEDDSDL